MKMSYRIEQIEGIGPGFATKLAKSGITSTTHLLEQCASANGRKAVAQATGVEERQLLKWANMADLMRINGVGEEYSELLEAAGVDTVKELKQRKAEHLAVRMAEVNASRKLVRQSPGAKRVAKWIEEAKSLPAMISH
jgi:predicted flap endonuclease-1-like 5' DNA nuclease